MAARGAVSPLQPPTSESCRSTIVVLRASWEAVFLGFAPESRFVPLFEVDRRLNYAVDTGPTAVATGDFNQDGITDLAVVGGGSGTVGILTGRGTGEVGDG